MLHDLSDKLIKRLELKLKDAEHHTMRISFYLSAILKEHFNGSVTINDKIVKEIIKKGEGGLQIDGRSSKTTTTLTYFETEDEVNGAADSQEDNDDKEKSDAEIVKLKSTLNHLLNLIEKM